MHPAISRALGRAVLPSPWKDLEPVREELFGVERLEGHAESLAAAQLIGGRPTSVRSLHGRLDDNARRLLEAYKASAAELESGRAVVPAAEWLLDNYHLVEEQIRGIREDLPVGYYRQLPKLSNGPFAGYPRVFGIAWAYVAHTDSHFDPEILRRFLVAYQKGHPLTIGELWAVAITLRIVLIENLRRLADQMTEGRRKRADADALTAKRFSLGDAQKALEADVLTRSPGPLSETFAAQLSKRLRDQDPQTTPLLGWLEERLRRQGASIEDVVLHAHQRQGASNVTVRNIINSMRLISSIDWAELFESVSLVDQRLRSASAFATMDFSTRNLYRTAIEQLARGSSLSEIEIAERALEAARAAQLIEMVPAEAARFGDPGYHLVSHGRVAFERTVDFKPSLRQRFNRVSIRLGIAGYVGSILALTAALLAMGTWSLSLTGLTAGLMIAFALTAFLPTTETATALINRAVTWSFGAVTLPGLDLKAGVPQSMRTLVAVPTLLTHEADLLEQIERLEVHYLSGVGGDIAFALLSDGRDSESEIVEGDAALLATAASAILKLNLRYGKGPSGDRFYLLHRRRVFNASENAWMGWERKRGKLHELNRLLRGADDTTFVFDANGAQRIPPDVRYVLTLDADTRLPRDAAMRMIGKMAHPLNRPKFDEKEQRVIAGHAILQPRVTPSLPIGTEGSFYQRAFSGPGGMDPYASAVSDVYQDLFGEGSYTGKGIYDVDFFEAALAGRVPENTLLSHDLFEGVFARAGLASDVEVVEDFPSRYDVVAKRQHRWTRGDWQLLPWIFAPSGGLRSIPAVGRWKMLDNLRRSIVAPSVLAAICVSWLMPLHSGALAILFTLFAVSIPAFLPTLFSLVSKHADTLLRHHFGAVLRDLRGALTQSALTIAFAADHAWRMVDAIIRTLARLFITHRRLLEWTTAAQASASPRLALGGFYRGMWGGVLLAIVLTAGAAAFVPHAWPLFFPFALAWLAAPALALTASRSPSVSERAVSEFDRENLRLVARRTWRFFETLVTPAENMLPPDNFQEDPKAVVAHRTSPTNIGLYLLSAVTARDFGWAGLTETVERLEATFEVLDRMARHRGHFFNWYGTRDLAVLEPAYVSTVDSGNLAGHLIVLANACEEWTKGAPTPDDRQALRDCVHLAQETLRNIPAYKLELGTRIFAAIDEISALLNGPQRLEIVSPALIRLSARASNLALAISPLMHDDHQDLKFWLNAIGKRMMEDDRDRLFKPHALDHRLRALEATAREMARAMDFAFLLEPDRKLLSIGYSLVDNGLDKSCYDLLASEARLASLFAIAKGDVPTSHWFRLGRAATPLGNASALLSWSGSMFEYLMPSLVMRAPFGSLLEQTNRLIVRRQERYGRLHDVPWGISESAYNARDVEFTYQYSNFGVPGLGLKRGLSDNLVIAPYATGLATMVDPSRAWSNFEAITDAGGLGRFGFYEALDYTRARLPQGQPFAVVRTFMAHHQGMTIVAIANALQNGRMRSRFHSEPMIKSCDLLLQERMPRDMPIAHPRAEEVKASVEEIRNAAPTVRRLQASASGAPVTHLLSNGRYAVMLTGTGGGYSRWRDMAVTRWREDTTRDDWGSFIFLRDTQSGQIWSGAAQPLGDSAAKDCVIFGEDQAEFVHHDDTLATVMDVIVSGEDDGEVRRVSLTNSGRSARSVEVTSYAELVLAAPGSDDAHQAFAKMFVQTEYLPEFGALIATRRKRSPHEPEVWAAHFAVVEGDILSDPQYESDRARFLGRGLSPGTAAVVVKGLPLSNTIGTVLDPIFSIRQNISVPAGKVARISFWTIVASSRDELLDLIDKHHDRSAFDRAKTLAWTQAQVQLRHLDISPDEASDFQRLASPILYSDPRFRVSSEAMIRGAGSQAGLWPHSISGDLPIVLLRIDDIEDMAQVRQVLRAHEYWRMKRLAVDVVIINERASSYTQDLQIAIETAVRSSQSRPRTGEPLAQGAAFTLRADLIHPETRALIHSVARLVIVARRGTLSEQLARAPEAATQAPPGRKRRASFASLDSIPAFPTGDLEFFNGTGGFDKNGQEYVTVLEGGRSTPAPWINVVANPTFGFQVSADGSGYTWAQNSRENQITAWSNDPVCDPAGEAIYIRDEATGDLCSATAWPIRDDGRYVARHGHGFTRFEHRANGLALDLLQFVPLADPIKISRLTIHNLSDRPRRLSVTAYAEWVLGSARGASGPFIATEMDASTGAMLARNRWSIVFSNRVAFSDLNGRQTTWTGDRTEFLGRHGWPSAPAALTGAAGLGNATGAGMDPCSALQQSVGLAVGASVEIVWFLGQCETVEDTRALVSRYRATDLDVTFNEVTAYWRAVLGTVQVKTPDRATDIMLNGWLLYQTLACRVWARSAFYQASGAYGFRDQLQDGMALSFVAPDETRRHLLRAAARQFVEGDVQHWWLPHTGQGVRSRISDDRVWLSYATATYIASSGDVAVLDEIAPFLEGPALRAEEHESFYPTMIADESGSLFEHCARGLDQSIALTGVHGLPLIGTGDWNDGMSRVGEKGAGESVWLGWLLIRAITLFAPLAAARGDERVKLWLLHAEKVKAAIEREAWDGDWYRRATYDDGTWLGSKDSEECSIDSIAQSWAVLSGAGDPVRAAQAMASVDKELIRRADGLALLFKPPFDKTIHDPGYIRGYPPGLRENGGQYSHAAMWAILAFAKLGQGDKAVELLSLVNPLNHARTPEDVARYRVEPYAVAADVYSVAPHVGRGGWTWYTGAAGWMYRAGIEGILGLRKEGAYLFVEPSIPADWPGFDVAITMGATCIDITWRRAEGDSDVAELDGVVISDGVVRAPLDGQRHSLVISKRGGGTPSARRANLKDELPPLVVS